MSDAFYYIIVKDHFFSEFRFTITMCCERNGLVSVLKCRLRFGYEAGGMLRILIGIILCLEFWKVGKTRCKQRVKHVSMMSPRGCRS